MSLVSRIFQKYQAEIERLSADSARLNALSYIMDDPTAVIVISYCGCSDTQTISRAYLNCDEDICREELEIIAQKEAIHLPCSWDGEELDRALLRATLDAIPIS